MTALRNRLRAIAGGKEKSDQKSPFVFQTALEDQLEGLFRYALRLAGQESDAEDLLGKNAV